MKRSNYSKKAKEDVENNKRNGSKKNRFNPKGMECRESDNFSSISADVTTTPSHTQPPTRHNNRRRRCHHHHHRNMTTNSSPNNQGVNSDDLVQDIEEQLQRQRQKRREQEELLERVGPTELPTTTTTVPKRVLGRFHYNEELQTYFPQSELPTTTNSMIPMKKHSKLLFLHHHDDDKDHDDDDDMSSDDRTNGKDIQNQTVQMVKTNLPMLLHARQSSIHQYKVFQMADLCVDHCLVGDRIRIVPMTFSPHNHSTPFVAAAAAAAASSVTNLQHVFGVDEEQQDPLTCKIHLHPAVRTMAVAEPQTLTSLLLLPTTRRRDSTTRMEPKLPAMSTVTSKYFHVNIQNHRIAVSHERNANNDHGCGIQLVRSFAQNSHIFGFYGLQTVNAENYFLRIIREEPTEYSFESVPLVHPGPIYDMAYLPSSHRFVGAPGRRSDSKPFTPFYIDVDSSGPNVLTTHKFNFPQSDTLCAEHHNMNESNVVVFGHRNGQLSLVDFRSSNGCAMMTSEDSGGILMNQQQRRTGNMSSTSSLLFGSTYCLALSPFDPYLLVARGSMGVCRLYDVRRMNHVVQELCVPSGAIHSSLTSRCCNGLVIDPVVGQVAIAPYIDDHEEPRFGIWSLRSGRMIANQHIVSSSFSSSSSSPDSDSSCTRTNYNVRTNMTLPGTLPYVELCSTPTQAWGWSSSGGTRGGVDDGENNESDHSKKADGNHGNQGKTEDSTDIQLIPEKARWGLWFKFGRPLIHDHAHHSTSSSSPPPTSQTFGCIHHVTFPGRII